MQTPAAVSVLLRALPDQRSALPPCSTKQMAWITLLPLTLWESCRWAMLPMSLLISFLLLGIEVGAACCGVGAAACVR